MADPPPGYRIGYRRPPLHSQFRKGRSGNRGGRRRLDKTLLALLNRALDRKVTIVGEDGVPQRMTQREAIVARLIARSAEADWRAARLLFDLMRAAEDHAPPEDEERATEAMRAELIRRLDRLAAEYGGGSEEAKGKR